MITLGQLLAVEVEPLVTLLQVLQVGECMALLDQSEAGVPPVGREDLGDGPAVAVLGLCLQRDG